MHYRTPAVVTLALALLAACGSGGGGGGTGGGGGGDGGGLVTLFQDDFAGSFPGSVWSVRQGIVEIDAGSGEPAPALRVGPNRARVEYTGTPFAVASPLSAFALLRADYSDIGTEANDTRAVFRIVDANVGGLTPLSLAEVTIGPPVFGGPPGQLNVAYRIAASGLGSVHFNESIPDDGTFHDYAFQVTSDGRGFWFRDGAQKLSTGTTTFQSTSGEVRFAFENTFGEQSRSFHVDEILVRRP